MRIERINKLIKEKISEILLKEINFKDALITVQNVETFKDLRKTKIGISVIPTEKSKKALDVLKKQGNNIQKELNKKIETRFVPKIEFNIDKGEENANRIERILKNI